MPKPRLKARNDAKSGKGKGRGGSGATTGKKGVRSGKKGVGSGKKGVGSGATTGKKGVRSGKKTGVTSPKRSLPVMSRAGPRCICRLMCSTEERRRSAATLS